MWSIVWNVEIDQLRSLDCRCADSTYHVREFVRHLVDHLIPKYHTIAHGVRLGDIRQEFPGTGLRELESISSDPLDSYSGEDGDLFWLRERIFSIVIASVKRLVH